MADFKTTLKRALGLGMLMEVAFIGGGYYFYQKYKKDEGKYCRGNRTIEHLMKFELLFPYRIP